jgi:leucine-zipper of insertion element IS481
MPWRECHKMDERLRFVARLLDGEKMAVLCREFEISRKTGYKIFSRDKDCGVDGLTDRSRRPYRHARQLPFQIEKAILQLKREHPSWGARLVRRRRRRLYEAEGTALSRLKGQRFPGRHRRRSRIGVLRTPADHPGDGPADDAGASHGIHDAGERHALRQRSRRWADTYQRTPFSAHGVDATGAVVVRRLVARGKLAELIAQLPPCLIGMEASGGAHEWARRRDRTSQPSTSGGSPRGRPGAVILPRLLRDE